MQAGIDLEASIRDKFNATSEKYGLATRLRAPAQCVRTPDLWVCFAENGNIRAWTRDPNRAEIFRVVEGLDIRPYYSSAPALVCSQNNAESEPVVTPARAGADPIGPSEPPAPDVRAALERIKPLYEKLAGSPLGMSSPWERKASNGKPLLYGGKRGLLAYGTIATWDEFDLIVEIINSLPTLLAALTAAPAPTSEPVAYITKAGLKNWLDGATPETHVLLRTGGDLRVALYLKEDQPCSPRK